MLEESLVQSSSMLAQKANFFFNYFLNCCLNRSFYQQISHSVGLRLYLPWVKFCYDLGNLIRLVAAELAVNDLNLTF